MKLTLDQKELLHSVLEHDGLKVLFMVAEELTKKIESDVLCYNLETGSDRALAISKARAEGARKLLSALSRDLESIRLAALNAQEK